MANALSQDPPISALKAELAAVKRRLVEAEEVMQEIPPDLVTRIRLASRKRRIDTELNNLHYAIDKANKRVIELTRVKNVIEEEEAKINAGTASTGTASPVVSTPEVPAPEVPVRRRLRKITDE